MKETVYLSYSGRNCEAVLQVMEAIVRSGFALVCDCMLPAHTPFEERMTRGIKDAGSVIAVITDDAEGCSYMDRELEYALQAGKRIVPVVVNGAQLPSKYARALNRMESVNVSEYPTKEEMAQVMAAIQ